MAKESKERRFLGVIAVPYTPWCIFLYVNKTAGLAIYFRHTPPKSCFMGGSHLAVGSILAVAPDPLGFGLGWG